MNERQVFGAGTYFIGDICYALDDKIYDDVWGKQYGYDSGAFEVDGATFVVGNTAYGDGTYEGSDEREYPVDAGVIGVVPKALWKKDADETSLATMGRVVEVTSLEFSDNNGKFTITLDGSRMTINTR